MFFHLLLFISFVTNGSTFTFASSLNGTNTISYPLPPPIVYTIAGSDSGGGAGIQADLLAIHSMGCHGCSAITTLTAQNSMGVQKNGIHAPPTSFLRKQLDTLTMDLFPRAVKVGMLGTKELAMEVGSFLKELKRSSNDEDAKETPLIVVDPVMISTSGSKLISDGTIEAMIENVFPYTDILTPNKFEAEELLGRKLNSPQDVEQGARDILKMGVKSVLMKGGHPLMESCTASSPNNNSIEKNVDLAYCGDDKYHEYAQDYFLSSENTSDNAERLCDSEKGVWIRGLRYETDNTHGSGCTLSSAIASALAIGHQQREMGENNPNGANAKLIAVDACVLGKAYVSAGIAKAVQLGEGPGPVYQTEFPSSSEFFPSIVRSSSLVNTLPFLPIQSSTSNSEYTDQTIGPILPIVDSVEWVQRLTQIKGVTDIQLRIKDEKDSQKIQNIVNEAQKACADAGVHLWVNDYWEAAIEAECFGVHLGQEDLKRCVDKGDLDRLQKSNLALGISTHTYAELASALGVKPSYISIGPVFQTTSKDTDYDPQGLEIVTKWRNLVPNDMPLVAIGGINTKIAERVKEAGADCVSVIGAITKSDNVEEAVQGLIEAMA